MPVNVIDCYYNCKLHAVKIIKLILSVLLSCHENLVFVRKYKLNLKQSCTTWKGYLLCIFLVLVTNIFASRIAIAAKGYFWPLTTDAYILINSATESYILSKSFIWLQQSVESILWLFISIWSQFMWFDLLIWIKYKHFRSKAVCKIFTKICIFFL